MRTTIKDIAQETGLSITTVSLILNGKGKKFPPDTKDLVLVAAKKLNYRPNQLAVGLLKKHCPHVDNRNETIGKKIREAETQKFPYMVIVGEEEEKNGTLSVRRHGGEDLGSMKIADFITLIQEEINKNVRPFSIEV